MSSSFPHYNNSLLSTSPTTAASLRPNLEDLITRARTHPIPRSRSPRARDRNPLSAQQPDAATADSVDVLENLDENDDLLSSSSTTSPAAYGATSTSNGHAARRTSFGSSSARARPALAQGEARGREHHHVEGKLALLDPQVLTADQGGETALEEEERLLGHAGGGDDGAESGGEKDWKVAVKAEGQILIYTTLPIMFTQVAEYSLAIVGVISIGHLSAGPIDLAASSLASMTASVSAFSILQGIASALDTLLPAAWTSSDPTRVGLWTQRVAIICLGAMLPIIEIWWNAESILLFLKQDPEVAHKASIYLRHLSIGLPGYAINCLAKKYLQAQNKLNIPTIVILVVAPFNIVLNYVLVWGPIPAVRIGFAGSPLATGISYNLEALLFVAYVAFSKDKRAWAGISFKQAFSKLGTCFTLALAGIALTASEWWAWECVTLAASLLGPTAMAAQSILLITCSTTYQAPFSLSMATSVRAGNLLGAGRGWEAKWAARTALGLAIGVALVNSTILLSGRQKFGLLFNSDPEVVARVAELLPLLAFFQLSDGLAGVASGILRVLGRQSIGALLNLSSYYVFSLPLGFYLCFNREMGLEGLWIGLSLALLYCAFGSCWIVFRADWGREVEKAAERLGRDNGGLGGGEEGRGLMEDLQEEAEEV